MPVSLSSQEKYSALFSVRTFDWRAGTAETSLLKPLSFSVKSTSGSEIISHFFAQLARDPEGEFLAGNLPANHGRILEGGTSHEVEPFVGLEFSFDGNFID